MPNIHTLLLVLCIYGTAHAQKFITYYDKGQYEKSLEACKKATEKNKKDLDAYLYKSLSYLQLGLHTERADTNAYKIEQALFVLELLKGKTNGENFLSQHQQEYDLIINSSLDVTQKLISANDKYAAKLLTALLKLEQRPEFYYASAKLKIQKGETHEGLEEMNYAASEIYRRYHNGGIQKPYLPELFVDLATGIMKEGDISSACIIFMRAIRLFQSSETIHVFYQSLESLAYSDVHKEKEEYETLLHYTDSLAGFLHEPETITALKWQFIQNCFTDLFKNDTHEEARKFLEEQVCGKKELSEKAIFSLQQNILSETKTGIQNNKDFVTVNTDAVQILSSMLICNNIKPSAYAEQQIRDSLAQTKVASAAKLFYIFSGVITDKNTVYELKSLFKEKTAIYYAQDSDYTTCRSIAVLVNDKSLYDLLSTQAQKVVEELLIQKKFNEAGKTIREELTKYPNSPQWKYLLKKWVIEDYNTNYRASETGYNMFVEMPDVENCKPGKLSASTQKQFLQRLNYVRRLAGIYEPCRLDEKLNVPAQAAALMMYANQTLNHLPPDTWNCFSVKGREGASHSNLSYGATGTYALMSQLEDDGGGNESVGHRRWILNPFNNVFGHGSTTQTMALYVFGTGSYDKKSDANYQIGRAHV